MPFYYLHKRGTGHPANEKDFKYILSSLEIYKDGDGWVQIPIENGDFCHHRINDTIQWDPDDEIIDVQNKHSKGLFVKFKKVYDEPLKMTIWEIVTP